MKQHLIHHKKCILIYELHSIRLALDIHQSDCFIRLNYEGSSTPAGTYQLVINLQIGKCYILWHQTAIVMQLCANGYFFFFFWLLLLLIKKKKKKETVILIGVKSVSSLRPKRPHKTGYILQMPIDPPSRTRNHSVTSSDAPTF